MQVLLLIVEITPHMPDCITIINTKMSFCLNETLISTYCYVFKYRIIAINTAL